jgi:hypothetical protein
MQSVLDPDLRHSEKRDPDLIRNNAILGLKVCLFLLSLVLISDPEPNRAKCLMIIDTPWKGYGSGCGSE